MTGTPAPDTGGPLMLVRYVYPPNALGYCGHHRVEHPGTVAVLG